MMTAEPVGFGQNSSYLQHPSPLDSLARTTSAKRSQIPGSPNKLTKSPPRKNLAPASPLLHSHFSRGSVATASTSSQDNTSYLDFRDSIDSRNVYQEISYGYYDADSVYSGTLSSPALRDSWQSANTVRNHLDAQPPPSPDSVPSVVVSSHDELERPGRAAIVSPAAKNFSRPVRPPRPSPDTMDLSDDLEEHKRMVLERNIGRRPSPVPSREPSPVPSPSSSLSPTQTPITPSSMMSRSVTLSRRPPSIRASSPASSLYSTYSFYQLDSATPSPTDDSPRFVDAQVNPQPKVKIQTPPQRTSPRSGTPINPKQSGAQTSQEYLQLGIAHHEANRLRESAICFEKSATVDGGCGVGMLMYGLALRHGWGCEKNEKTGFKWLRKAAESAVEDLESMRKGKGAEGSTNMSDSNTVQSELILAIYEVGQCFFHGWGVAKDQKMGVSYYQVAARLGDPDAQSDLAFCLANGKGCKKDRKEAAKWYRAAVAQGQSDIGLAWIYKEKFQ